MIDLAEGGNESCFCGLSFALVDVEGEELDFRSMS